MKLIKRDALTASGMIELEVLAIVRRVLPFRFEQKDPSVPHDEVIKLC